MSYTVISHNDETNTFIIEVNGYSITLDYPGDIEVFAELSSEDIDLLASGFEATHADLTPYEEPVASTNTNSGEWF